MSSWSSKWLGSCCWPTWSTQPKTRHTVSKFWPPLYISWSSMKAPKSLTHTSKHQILSWLARSAKLTQIPLTWTQLVTDTTDEQTCTSTLITTSAFATVHAWHPPYIQWLVTLMHHMPTTHIYAVIFWNHISIQLYFILHTWPFNRISMLLRNCVWQSCSRSLHSDCLSGAWTRSPRHVHVFFIHSATVPLT